MKRYLVVFLLFLFVLPAAAQATYLNLKSIVQVSSTVSEGNRSLDEIAQLAKGNGIEVVVFTDRDLLRWEYGIASLARLIKRRVEHKSVFTYGVGNYLKDIKTLRKKYPQLVLIPGVESAPFYYWQGFPLGPNFQMHDWHQHLLAIGMEDAADYQLLPVVGNQPGLLSGPDLRRLWPLLFLLVGFFGLRKRKYNYRDLAGHPLGPRSRAWLVCSLVMIGIGLLFSLNNWPYRAVKFDQYQGDLGGKPYQHYIDYVKSKGGLSFWAHPEAVNSSKIGRISFHTPAHSEKLLATENYTGYCVFYEGYKEIGRPGGIWDELLDEYCSQLRSQPAWAIGGLSLDENDKDASAKMKDMQTVILAEEKSPPAVLEALRQGRMYVAGGKHSLEFALDEFSLSGGLNSAKQFMGGTLLAKTEPVLQVKGSFLDREQELKIRIIYHGDVVATYSVTTPFDIKYVGAWPEREKSYYRVEVAGSGLRVVTNPIFVELAPEEEEEDEEEGEEEWDEDEEEDEEEASEAEL